MKKTLIFLTVLLFAASSASAEKKRVVTTYPYIASIVSHVAKDRVTVESLAPGTLDPHTITPKPSHIARLRRADLLIINGAQLEIGWLPALIRQANNSVINPGSSGFIDLSCHVKLIDKPVSVSRESGDVHPEGNPHFALNPDNIPLMARAITEKLKKLDAVNSSAYENGCINFISAWKEKNESWKIKLLPLRGVKIVEYHRVFDYFLRYAGMELAGTIEPLPGIPPSSGHIFRLGETVSNGNIKLLLQDVYNPDAAARHIAEKYKMRLVVLPHDAGAVEGTDDIFLLFDCIVRRLTE